MKNQHKVISIYACPVLLVALAILVNGCAERFLEDINTTRNTIKIQVYNIVIPPDEISSLEVNIELKDNIHLYDVMGENNAYISQFHKFGVYDYKLALIQSLIDASYNGNPLYSKYVLRTDLIEVGQPSCGFSCTATTIVEYILKERNSGKEIFRKTIETSYRESFRDSQEITNILMANEGSVRKNIYEFLQAISKLEIEYHEVSMNR